MTVFLCGFMGCGKSTIGLILAKQLGIGFIDMDTYIEERTNMRIAEIFEKFGEEYFRCEEEKALEELCNKKAVIACGGGTMLSSKNAEKARRYGEVIFIDTPFDDCYSRIRGDAARPILNANRKEELRKIFDDRHPVYQNNATVIAHVQEMSPLQSANYLCNLCRSKRKSKKRG